MALILERYYNRTGRKFINHSEGIEKRVAIRKE